MMSHINLLLYDAYITGLRARRLLRKLGAES